MVSIEHPRADLLIRRESVPDREAIRRVVGGAFGSSVEPDLVERIRASPEYVPELALVADLGGEVIGHVMISGAIVRSEVGDRRIVMLSPLAVSPDHERRGVGSALVRAATARADERGEPLVVVEGDPAYYGRFGFEHSLAHGLEIRVPDWAPSEAGQVLLLSNHDPDDQSLRGLVVYPAAFDGLD